MLQPSLTTYGEAHYMAKPTIGAYLVLGIGIGSGRPLGESWWVLSVAHAYISTRRSSIVTSMLTTVIVTIIRSNNNQDSLAILHVISTLLLIVLLTEAELLRAFGSVRARELVRILTAAIVPLLLVFGFIITTRFMELLIT
jgi:hypothetical protein